jgi:hypothetical protein
MHQWRSLFLHAVLILLRILVGQGFSELAQFVSILRVISMAESQTICGHHSLELRAGMNLFSVTTIQVKHDFFYANLATNLSFRQHQVVAPQRDSCIEPVGTLLASIHYHLAPVADPFISSKLD